jgi:hypothetical protein
LKHVFGQLGVAAEVAAEVAVEFVLVAVHEVLERVVIVVDTDPVDQILVGGGFDLDCGTCHGPALLLRGWNLREIAAAPDVPKAPFSSCTIRAKPTTAAGNSENPGNLLRNPV